MLIINHDLHRELRELRNYWNLPALCPGVLPPKQLLNGEPVEGEPSLVRLDSNNARKGRVEVYQSVDPRDILGNVNWACGWRSCLLHQEEGRVPGNKRKRVDYGGPYDGRRWDDARDVALWAAHTAGVSLLYAWDGHYKMQGGITRRAMRARAWLFELESGDVVYHSPYGDPEACFDLKGWIKGVGYTCYGLISQERAQRKLAQEPLPRRMVKGIGPLCQCLDHTRERLVWEGWMAHHMTPLLKGPRFWQTTQTRLSLATTGGS